MKKILIAALVFLLQLFNAQNVYLTKVEKTYENTDKSLYKIHETKDAEYLGEVEVQGFSKYDDEVFALIYKKAKEIGANTYILKPFETINGTNQNFNPSNYRLSLYFLPKAKMAEQTGYMYIFASSDKDQKIAVNGKDYMISPRSYIVLKTVPGEVYTISTKKLLGSTIKIQPRDNSSNQYFQISAAKIRSDNTGTGGLNLKSGDIIGLESSYGDFLSTIYNQQKAE
ncbi:hypothetical protein FY557_11295 [Chryseobacterium sp. SN22]|uniref:hypothetical protein n=1 Tax=Chryseobacterium sp. SN22 TaxID=2606431 RepID=UPI0011ED50F6|nr:hypothetical protein [Chryseobacterium sp. SN22]KAA0127984.1 hypothetical protein FY557_11295 [Chryseobacterium sp. SN22]